MQHRSKVVTLIGARHAARRAADPHHHAPAHSHAHDAGAHHEHATTPERARPSLLARARSLDGVTIGIAFILTIAAAATVPFGDAQTLGAFVLLIAAGELFEVTLPNDVPYSLGLAPGIGFALLLHQTISATVIVFALGMLLATIVRAARGRALLAADSATHVIALTAATVAYSGIARVSGLPAFHTRTHSSVLSVFGLLAMLIVIPLTETVISAVRAHQLEGVPFAPMFVNVARSTIALHVSIVSVGALLALAYPPLRAWAFPLFLAPLAATQYAFRQFAQIRTTYLQTIRALSKVPEMAGYTQEGHSRRVADISVAIARELGVQADEAHEIEYAALLHDIGRLSVNDPSEVDAADHRELALMGATIVRQTGHFPRVADMIEQQHVAYRRKGEDSDHEVRIGSRIIKVASAYDDLTKPGGIGLSPWDALERLHLGMAYDYDPTVIQGLTRVLEKRGTI